MTETSCNTLTDGSHFSRSQFDVAPRHGDGASRLRRLLELDSVFERGPVAVTQEEIATMAGTTRPTVNRVMQDLAEAGLVELGRGRFTVVDPAALARTAR